MKAKHIGDRYANFDDGTCFPLPETPNEHIGRVAWALRYGQELTKSQRIFASDVIGAYEALIARTAKRRQEIVMAIRDAVEEREARRCSRCGSLDDGRASGLCVTCAGQPAIR